MEQRCLVCGGMLGDKWHMYNEKDTKKLETCSDECAGIYFEEDDEERERKIQDLQDNKPNVLVVGDGVDKNLSHELCKCSDGKTASADWKHHQQYCPIWKNGRIEELEKEQKRVVNEAIEVTHDLSANNGVLKNRIEYLTDLIKRIISTLPNQKNDYSGVGWCAGCGAVLYVSGDQTPSDPCLENCVLQEAKQLLTKQ